MIQAMCDRLFFLEYICRCQPSLLSRQSLQRTLPDRSADRDAQPLRTALFRPTSHPSEWHLPATPAVPATVQHNQLDVQDAPAPADVRSAPCGRHWRRTDPLRDDRGWQVYNLLPQRRGALSRAFGSAQLPQSNYRLRLFHGRSSAFRYRQQQPHLKWGCCCLYRNAAGHLHLIAAAIYAIISELISRTWLEGKLYDLVIGKKFQFTASCHCMLNTLFGPQAESVTSCNQSVVAVLVSPSLYYCPLAS